MKNKLLSVCLFLFLFSIIFLLIGCPTIDKPPKLTIPDKTVNEGQVLQFDLKQYAEDKDKNTLAFTIVSGVGEIVGSDYRYTPTFDDSGDKEVKIRVTNAKGKFVEDTFKITVNDVNRPPMLDIRDQTMNEGETVTLNLNDYADDPDGDALTFTLVSGVGNIAGSTYTYTTTYTDAGTKTVTVRVTDNKGGNDESTFRITVNEIPNQKPKITIPDLTIKEGETKNHTITIVDEDPLSLLEVAVSSDKYNISTRENNGTDLLLTFTPKDKDYNGPFSVTVQATDTQNLSEKVTKTFQVTPMTDLELKILGQTLNVSGGIVVGSQISNQSNVNVKVYQRDVNWVEKEEYGDLYHYRIGIDSALGELLFEGTTNSQGSIKFQVDPMDYDEGLLYVVLGKSGFLDKTRHFFADSDLGSTSLILSKDNTLINEWLYYSLCNNGYQPMDGGVYIPKGNVTWRHQIFSDFPKPNIVVVKGDDEYVAQNVLDAIPEAVEHVFGPGYNISYASELGTPQENTIYVEFWDYQIGQVWISTLPVSNLMKLGGIKVGREYPLEEQIFSSLIHEFGHLLFINAHKEDMDSHYRQDKNFSTYPYFSGVDKAVQQLVLAVGNMLPGDKYVYEGSSLKQLSFSVIKGEKVYYLKYE